jgi:hypothetical protein
MSPETMLHRLRDPADSADRGGTDDPRELEDWFLRLPPAVQDDLREKWRTADEKFAPWRERCAAFRKRCLLEGVFAVGVPVLLASFGLGPILFAIPLGLATGWLWWHLDCGRLTSGAIGSGATFLALSAGGVFAGSRDVPGFVFTCFAVFLSGLLCAGLGLRRELDRREQAL